MTKQQEKIYKLLKEKILESNVTLEHFSQPNNIRQIEFGDKDIECALIFALSVPCDSLINEVSMRLIQREHEKLFFENERLRKGVASKLNPLMK